MSTTDTQTVRLLRNGDASCWQEAIRVHNAQLKGGPSNKKYINVEARSDDNKASSNIHADELMTVALGTYRKLKKKRGPIATTLIQIQHTLHRHSQAIDVFAQANPLAAGLVWGSVRILLQITEDEERASRIAGEGIMKILLHVGRWEQASAISDLLQVASVKKAIVSLYTTVLDFLISSAQWLRQARIQRLGFSILSLKGDKFEGKLNQLIAASELVDKEIQTHATHRGLLKLDHVTIDIRDSMHKIDTVMEHVRRLSDHTMQLQLSSQPVPIGENVAAIQNVFTELRTLPASIANMIVEQMQDKRELSRVQQWLSLNAVEMLPTVSWVEGTCQWLLEDPAFLEWKSLRGDPVLWIQGLPGRGKSVMAGYLREHLEATGAEVLFYRFQRSASRTHSTPTAFASSLIFQLLGRSTTWPTSCLLDQIQSLITHFPLGPHHCSFNKIWGIMTALMLQCGIRFHLVIDALDECSLDDSSLPSITGLLNNLFDNIQRTNSGVVILTRPEPMFFTATQPHPSIRMAEDILLPDIMTFARNRYEKLDLPDDERNVVLERVGSSSHGSFRWTELFLDHLGDSLHAAEFRSRLHALPPSLTDLYRSAFTDPSMELDQAQVKCRRALLLMNFQAQRPLKVSEAQDALSLRPERAEKIIIELCKPLISIEGGCLQESHPSVREFFEAYDRTNDDTLGIRFSDSHSMLAEKCLSSLLDEKFADPETVGSYLRASYDEEEKSSFYQQPSKESFYQYASRYWDYHLTQIKSPRTELLQHANKFLLSFQFAFWADHSRQDLGQFVGVFRALDRLRIWHKQLTSEEKAFVEIDKYFEHAYQQLSIVLKVREGYVIPYWLALVNLGDFYYGMGFSEKATRVREQVSVGLCGLLGPRHPLSLRVRTDVAYNRLYAGKMRAARTIYNELLDIQHDVLGPSSLQALETLVYKGESEYYMTEFSAALATFKITSEEFLRLLGPESWQYMGAQLWYALSMAQLDELEASLQILQSVLKKRRDQFGPEDTFATVAQIALGEVLRMAGRYEESIANLQEALIERRGAYPLSDPLRLDVEIALVKTYQAAGLGGLASAIIDEIEEKGNLNTQFERLCQVLHLKGHLLSETGSRDRAIDLYQDTLIQAEPDQNNRTLLWMRLDLADMLRHRDDEGDQGQASANFDNLVKDVSGESEPGFPDEPDPPRLLAAAEKALLLVRSRHHEEARRALDSARVEWLRPSDFWIWVGGGFLP